jgi:5-deoxy-glucuronate isomerase
MRQYNCGNLLVRPRKSGDPNLIVDLRPEDAGWTTLYFQVRRLEEGQSWSRETGDHELALVMLRGRLDVSSSRGRWASVGRRDDVFKGLPHALYLPRHTTFAATALTGSEFAVASVAAGMDFPPCLVQPGDVSVEIRGADNATRQIHSIIPPGFPCERLVVVEVYTPGGNWSSYPPHKHDVHRADSAGRLIEADLDEIYYYRIDPPEGFALQRIYTGTDSPLHRAGFPIDAAVVAHHNDIVLVPEGYHPVGSPVGYTTYYLNVLAGSAQSLACSDDPQYAWIKGSYRTPDPRIPIFSIEEAKRP